MKNSNEISKTIIILYAKKQFMVEEAKNIADKIGIKWSVVDFTVEDFIKGMNVEIEHDNDPKTDVVRDDVHKWETIGKIAWRHLKESPSYYDDLEKMESKFSAKKKMKKENPCWEGYEMIGTKDKDGKEVPNCVKKSSLMRKQSAKYNGKEVQLNKPFRTPDGPKKFSVYVKNENGNVVKVNFGDPDMDIKRDDPDRKKSFRARHKCNEKKDKTTPGYWSCKMWSDKNVSDLT